MKRNILFFAILLPIFCSCQKYVRYTPSSQENLKNYACNLFYDKVAAPALAMDLAYDLQAFLNLSDEERKTHRFANMVAQYDYNKYAVLLQSGLTALVIDTNGKDLSTPGTQWGLYFEAEALYNLLKVDLPYSISEASLLVSCTGPGQWKVSNDASIVGNVVLHSDDSRERIWLAGVSGKDTDANATGIEARYLTCDLARNEAAFEISLNKLSKGEDSDRSYSFEGTFLVEISSFGQPMERAFILGKSGFLLNCITEVIGTPSF